MNEEKVVWIGIDQSYHSTGLTIQFSDKPNIIFYQFCDSREKHSMNVNFVLYQRVKSNTDNFSKDEQNRIKSAHNLFMEIYKYLQMHCKEYTVWNVAIEGQVMSGFSKNQMMRLTDLVCLGTILRYNFMRLKQVRLNIFPPTTIKKYFTGSGKAKKEDMIREFVERFPVSFQAEGKIDDVVDSYALCEIIHRPENKKVLPRKKKTRVAK